MSINKLNLQIGGNKESKEDSLLEEVGLSFAVDDLLEELVEDKQEEIIEEHGDFLVKALDENMPELRKPEIPEEWLQMPKRLVEEVVTEEPEQLTRQERMAESMSLYHAKTRQSLEEVASVSDGDRIQMLEDAFAQMKRGRPQTLVSGIGASLDSGGGAVWLWDLEDINIGTPLNGVYPSITDGSFLAYNAADKSWEAVEDASSANILSGGVIKATGGAANSGGNLVIEATDATNGNFTIKNASDAETVVIDGSSGNTTFKGGQVIVERAPTLSSCFQIKGKTVNFPQDTNSVLFGNIEYSNGSDAMQYYGLTVSDNDIANKKYVDDAVDGLDPSGGFTFKGTTDVTGTAPGSPAPGDFYINTVAGTASSSWTGIATLTIAADQLVIYSGSSSRWFAGSVEGANPTVLKAGDTMTGALTIAPTTGTNALVIKDGNSTTAQIFKGGSSQFTTVSCTNISSNNVKPVTDDTYKLGDSSLSWKSAHINTINTTAVVNTGTLDVSGTAQLGTATAGTRIILGNTNMVGHTSTPTYFIEGGKSANLVIGRCSDNNMAIPQLSILGKTNANDGVKTNELVVVRRIAGNVADAFSYYGRTSGSDDIQTKRSCDSTYAQLSTSNAYTSTQNIKVDPAQFALTVEPTASTVDTIRLMGSGEIQFTQLTQTTTNLPNTLKSTTTVEGDFNTSGNVTFAHSGSASSTDWKIQGKTVASPSSDTGSLLSVFRPTSNSPDAISYNGTTSGDAYIQTRASVQALIAVGNTDWISFKGTLSGFASNSIVEYRLVDGGKSCQIRIHLNQGGAYFGPTSSLDVGTLPTAARPNFNCLFPVMPKTFPMEKLREVVVNQNGSVVIQPPVSGTTQDLFANFMYPTST